ncbi:MAG: hypothetical protein ACI9R7_001377 [Lysobacterales bacterium]|jgi:hypothetical protein
MPGLTFSNFLVFHLELRRMSQSELAGLLTLSLLLATGFAEGGVVVITDTVSVDISIAEPVTE